MFEMIWQPCSIVLTEMKDLHKYLLKHRLDNFDSFIFGVLEDFGKPMECRTS
jgi:hypothetical protein